MRRLDIANFTSIRMKKCHESMKIVNMFANLNEISILETKQRKTLPFIFLFSLSLL